MARQHGETGCGRPGRHRIRALSPQPARLAPCGSRGPGIPPLMKDLLVRIAERLMRCPAAPFHEELVAAEVIHVCDEFKLRYEIDSFGNFLICAGKRTTTKPIVLAAHMDHPGFVIRQKASANTVTADFLGGVGDSYFKSG